MSQHEETDVDSKIDPVWTSSRTARQIYALGEVEKDIAKLMALAASSLSLLTMPLTDAASDALPQGEERSEQFVLEVSEYFERLDAVHIAIRSSLAHIRQSRISPATIIAPPHGTAPLLFGVGLPPPATALTTAASSNSASLSSDQSNSMGLQEQKLERDAWKGIVSALTRLKSEKDAQPADSEKMDTD